MAACAADNARRRMVPSLSAPGRATLRRALQKCERKSHLRRTGQSCLTCLLYGRQPLRLLTFTCFEFVHESKNFSQLLFGVHQLPSS